MCADKATAVHAIGEKCVAYAMCKHGSSDVAGIGFDAIQLV